MISEDHVTLNIIIILLQLKYIFDFNMYFNCINISHTKKNQYFWSNKCSLDEQNKLL